MRPVEVLVSAKEDDEEAHILSQARSSRVFGRGESLSEERRGQQTFRKNGALEHVLRIGARSG